MDIAAFETAFDTFQREAFRLERLSRYDVPQDQQRIAAYLAGEPLPPQPKQQWLDFIGRTVQSGRRVSRVHILRSS